MGKLKNNFFKNWDLIIIGILVFLSLFPYIIQNGYFLGIDFIFGPEISLIDGQYYPNYTLWIQFQKLLSYILPTIIIQKLIFIGFFIIGIFSIRKFMSIFTQNKFIIFILSLLFIINPFIYPRLVQGQMYILFASALLPLVYYFLYKNSLLRLSIIIGIILSFSPHFVFIIIPLILAYYIINGLDIKNKYQIIYGIFIILLINIYWILNINDKTNILNFNINDIQSFQSHSIYFKNIYLEVLSLNGFWGDVEKRYLIEINNFKYFYLIFLIGGTILGMLISWKKDRRNFFFFSILIIIGFILSLGISEKNIFQPFNMFLYENIPFYIGMRESNKFSILLLIGYIYFIILSLDYILSKIRYKINILLIVFFIIIMHGSSMVQIFGGQIKGYKYPESWHEIKYLIDKKENDKLSQCNFKTNNITKTCYSVISFPRHQSIGLGFIKKIITNPVGVFFGKQVLLGDNIEIRNIYSQSTRPESKIIEKYIGLNGLFKKEILRQEDLKSFINDLTGLGIKNIILLKEADYKNYGNIFLELQKKSFIKIEKENDIITLYTIYDG